MTFTDGELAAMKSQYQPGTVRKWRRETVYRVGAVVEHEGVKYERTFEGLSYTPPPDCTSGWKRAE